MLDDPFGVDNFILFLFFSVVNGIGLYISANFARGDSGNLKVVNPTRQQLLYSREVNQSTISEVQGETSHFTRLYSRTSFVGVIFRPSRHKFHYVLPGIQFIRQLT